LVKTGKIGDNLTKKYFAVYKTSSTITALAAVCVLQYCSWHVPFINIHISTQTLLVLVDVSHKYSVDLIAVGKRR